MPELPEVETICRQLQKHLAGKTIKTVQVLYPKVVHGSSTADFVRALRGKKVRAVGRQGKLILIRLQGGKTLVVHLKMTGRLMIGGDLAKPNVGQGFIPRRGGAQGPALQHGQSEGVIKSTEILFTFTDGTILRYDDLRRFGYMKVVPTSEEARVVQKEALGVDFFDRTLTLEKFMELIRSRGGSQIKPLLLDQSLIAGIGNIYAQEACFAARIHPLRKASSLNERELKDLYQALYVIMKKAIAYGGTTADDYRDAYGNSGQFARYLKVYGREGQLCLRCKTKLLKKNIGGRGTVFCKVCQRV